jgi:hypothetical protein
MYKSYIFFLCGLFILESLQLLSGRGSFDIDVWGEVFSEIKGDGIV